MANRKTPLKTTCIICHSEFETYAGNPTSVCKSERQRRSNRLTWVKKHPNARKRLHKISRRYQSMQKIIDEIETRFIILKKILQNNQYPEI